MLYIFSLVDCSELAHPCYPCVPETHLQPGRCGPGHSQDPRSISSLTRVIPHNARWREGRARETVTTLQWADARPGRRRVRGGHSQCPGWCPNDCCLFTVVKIIWLDWMILKSNLTFIIRMAIHHLSSIKFIFIRRKWISLPHIKMSGSLTLVWP